MAERREIGQNDIPECEKHKVKFTEHVFQSWSCPECRRLRLLSAENAKIALELIKKLNVPGRFKGCSFDNYKTKSNHQIEAKKAIKKYVSTWPHTGGVIMIGGVGTGKTHLATAMCVALCNKQVSCKITKVNRVIRDIRASWSKNNNTTEAEIIRYFSRFDMLVIDEIGSQYGSDSEKIIINEIIDDRYEAGRPTVVIGNVDRSTMADLLGTRVIDRLLHGGIELIFDWESYRKQTEVVK